MFVRKATFEKLLKQVETQRQEIESLSEKLGLLAEFHGQQFQFAIGEGWKLSCIPPGLKDFIDAKRKAAHSPDSSRDR
jgi:hypothetical protein